MIDGRAWVLEGSRLFRRRRNRRLEIRAWCGGLRIKSLSVRSCLRSDPGTGVALNQLSRGIGRWPRGDGQRRAEARACSWHAAAEAPLFGFVIVLQRNHQSLHRPQWPQCDNED
jgi:hypothetical protein